MPELGTFAVDQVDGGAHIRLEVFDEPHELG